MASTSAGPLRILFDTSAILDLFARWTDDHRQRRGDMIREVELLRPLSPFLYSTEPIRDEIRRQTSIAGELSRYIHFESVGDLGAVDASRFPRSRWADLSLTALARRMESSECRVFILTKDRTFVEDLRRMDCHARIVPPTGFAEAITVISRPGSRSEQLAHQLQNNAFVNISRDMQIVKKEQGEAAYSDWQTFLNSRTPDRHDLIEAVRATRVRLD